MTSVGDQEPHNFEKLGPDPHQSRKQDPHPSEKERKPWDHFRALEVQIWIKVIGRIRIKFFLNFLKSYGSRTGSGAGSVI